MGAAPAPEEAAPVILILKQTQNHDTEKQEYSFSYEAENGISVSESGVQKQIGDKPEESGTVSQGKFSYPEGSVTYTINWVADENGFQAKGAHSPTHARPCRQDPRGLESRWPALNLIIQP